MINESVDCIGCTKRQGVHCTGYIEFARTQTRELPPEPFSGCIIPITERYQRLIKSGDRVLEIGCGAWSPIKEYCQIIGAEYEGIDTEEYYGSTKSVATRIENLGNLSFPNDTFDFVFGNQTFEHWEEYGCGNSWGLFQCFRVCKTGGIVALNVPIHFHGTKLFVNGELNAIRNLLSDFSSEVTFTSWGKQSRPLPQYFAHPFYPLLRSKSAYTLDIIAIKNIEPKKTYSNNYMFKGILARFISYPKIYFLYLTIRRLFRYIF